MEFIKGLQHLGLPVNDSAKAVAFYKELGFSVIYETMNGTDKVVFLEKNGLVIETYENGAAALTDGAWNHICLDVDNVEEAWNEIIVKRGYEAIDGGMQELPFFKNGVRFFKIKGPNEEIVEFGQIL